MSRKNLSTLAMAVRLFMVWWFLAILLFSFLGALMGEALDGMGVGCIFFPWIAGTLAALGTILQYRSLKAFPFAHSLGAFHHAVIQVSIASGEVEKELATILQEDLAARSFSMATHRLQALFQPPEWSGWWRRWALSDEVIVDVIPANPGAEVAAGCTLELSARPLSLFLYGFMWIDRGRNYKRLRRIQDALAERMAQENLRKEATRKSDSLEVRLAQAQLLLLRAQVEPHFLFNTLAHLRELIISGEGSTSLAMIDHLIAYSRSVSDRIRQATHRLEQELEAARSYLSLIQIRFGDRLSFEIQVEEEILDCEVPVGCLLIPIENAIKHGIEPRNARGFVAVRAHLADGSLLLEVQDDGPGLSMDPGAGHGTGLANLRERLELLHSNAARLVVEDHDAGGVLVRVMMPVLRKI